MIRTHGLIGQYIKGEVNLEKNILLYNLVKEKKISKEKLRDILRILNKCIIEAVSPDLYIRIKDSVNMTIDLILDNKMEEKQEENVTENKDDKEEREEEKEEVKEEEEEKQEEDAT